MNELKDQRITTMMMPSEVKAIDDWRRSQPDLPNRSEAVRRLVAVAIETTAKPEKKKK